MDFAARLIHTCLHSDPPLATRAQFAKTLDHILQSGLQSDVVEALRADMSLTTQNASTKDVFTRADVVLRDQLAYCFVEWLKIYGVAPSSERNFVPFITQLQEQGILDIEETSISFFRVCVELSIESYHKQLNSIHSETQYQPADALSKLIVLMARFHSDKFDKAHRSAKSLYFDKVLSIISLVLAHQHETLADRFSQKPFFRIFSSLLTEINEQDESLGSVRSTSLLSIA